MVVILLKEYFIILNEISVCQYFPKSFCIIFWKVGIIFNFSESQNLNLYDIYDWHASLEKG